ncbi:hypothetical protein C8R44DRAFT_771766 [Mycena epipterygia]|nr:hypothetical protein C8R44DRAFT_771766 [Mycena epipterygia]
MAERSLNRIPPEILYEIFSLVTAPVSSEERGTAASDYALWTLGHICGRWRAAAISHSMMWCTIYIRKGWPPPVDLLDRQLQLSRNLPLNIVFYQSRSDRCIGLFKALVACSNRWRKLSLTLLHEASPFLRTLERVRGQIPILHTLNFEGWATTTGNPFAFEVAPSLRDVTLRFTPVPIIPWRQLNRLSMTCAFSSLLPVLQLAQSVQELTVHLLDHSGPFDSDIQPIHLPCVSRCLLFHKCVIDSLVLPQLEVFIVEPDTASSVVPLLERSSCSLKKLGLYGKCTVTTVTSILEYCPTLSEITVVGLAGSEAAYFDLLVAQLSRRADNHTPLVVPHLKHLFVMADNIDQAAFVDMVEARWRVSNSGHQLEQITALLNEKWDDEAAKRLMVFQEEGLGVRI